MKDKSRRAFGVNDGAGDLLADRPLRERRGIDGEVQDGDTGRELLSRQRCIQERAAPGVRDRCGTERGRQGVAQERLVKKVDHHRLLSFAQHRQGMDPVGEQVEISGHGAELDAPQDAVRRREDRERRLIAPTTDDQRAVDSDVHLPAALGERVRGRREQAWGAVEVIELNDRQPVVRDEVRGGGPVWPRWKKRRARTEPRGDGHDLTGHEVQDRRVLERRRVLTRLGLVKLEPGDNEAPVGVHRQRVEVAGQREVRRRRLVRPGIDHRQRVAAAIEDDTELLTRSRDHPARPVADGHRPDGSVCAVDAEDEVILRAGHPDVVASDGRLAKRQSLRLVLVGPPRALATGPHRSVRIGGRRSKRAALIALAHRAARVRAGSQTGEGQNLEHSLPHRENPFQSSPALSTARTIEASGAGRAFDVGAVKPGSRCLRTFFDDLGDTTRG